MNPRLRFKKADGTEYPDWEEKKLEDITSFIRNGFSYKEGNNKNFPVSRIETISDRIVNYNRIGYAEFVPEDYLLKTGDILFSNINSLEHIGKTAFYESNSKLYHGMNLICLRPSDINNKFLFYLLNTETVKKINYIHAKRAVSQCSISVSDIRSYKLQIPYLEEQEKIADFLSDIDEVILASDQEVKKLQELKKGAMQKIFSQEVRFKKDDGTDYPDWEEKNLGEVAKISTGYAFKNSDYCKNGEFLVITNANIQDNDYQVLNNVGNRINLLDKYSKYILNKNDILVTMDGTVGRVAKVCDDRMLLAQRVGRVVSSSIYNEYLFQFLSSNIFYTEMKNNAKGAMIAHISLRDIENCPVFLPCLEEQQKIGDFLSDFDEAISLAKQELEKWKLLKKGLLQQMFT